MIELKGFDHIVLTVSDVKRSFDFYTQVLGMQAQGNSLFFGKQCIHIHAKPGEFLPSAKRPQPGSADLCFAAGGNINEIVEHLMRCRVKVEEGPVLRTGARGNMTSIYLRDPDGNLIEISVYE
ncbi:MAG: VOC family protein [Christensenellales bacterium]|jgi:catechol 2,3-dioxygenase-like lactoylglutathione lyase family enzyme